MHFYPNERLALFIDGANLYATAKSLGFDIDYKRLLALFRTKGQWCERSTTPQCAWSSIWITWCCTGDGDFRALVAAMQMRGRRVSVVSTLQTQPPMVADELRRQADQFIDLADLEDQICRDPATRPVREPGSRPIRSRQAPAPAVLDY